MNVKKLRKLAKAKKILSNIGMALAGLLFYAWIGWMIFDVVQHYRVETRTALSESYDLVEFKNGDYAVRMHGSIRRIGRRFDEYYTFSDCPSVMVLEKEKKKHSYFTSFSLETGNLSERYIRMGRPGTNGNPTLIACVDKSNKLGFVNAHTGKLDIACRFYYDEDDSRYSSIYEMPRFHGPYCVLNLTKDREGILTTCGYVELKADRIIDYRKFVSECPFKGFCVTQDNKMSLYSAGMDCLMSDKEDISLLNQGVLYRDSEEGDYFLTDYYFEDTIPVFVVNEIEECESILSEVEFEHIEDDAFLEFTDLYGNTGIIDEDMNLIIKPEWDMVDYIGNGYFVCYVCDGFGDPDLGFLMDKNGKFVMPREKGKVPDRNRSHSFPVTETKFR